MLAHTLNRMYQFVESRRKGAFRGRTSGVVEGVTDPAHSSQTITVERRSTSALIYLHQADSTPRRRRPPASERVVNLPFQCH